MMQACGFGMVDLAKGTAAMENTPYPIASLTKTFAAAVIMRLVEAGKLDLDEAMSTYDPGYAQWCADPAGSTQLQLRFGAHYGSPPPHPHGARQAWHQL